MATFFLLSFMHFIEPTCLKTLTTIQSQVCLDLSIIWCHASCPGLSLKYQLPKSSDWSLLAYATSDQLVPVSLHCHRWWDYHVIEVTFIYFLPQWRMHGWHSGGSLFHMSGGCADDNWLCYGYSIILKLSLLDFLLSSCLYILCTNICLLEVFLLSSTHLFYIWCSVI